MKIASKKPKAKALAKTPAHIIAAIRKAVPSLITGVNSTTNRVPLMIVGERPTDISFHDLEVHPSTIEGMARFNSITPVNPQHFNEMHLFAIINTLGSVKAQAIVPSQRFEDNWKADIPFFLDHPHTVCWVAATFSDISCSFDISLLYMAERLQKALEFQRLYERTRRLGPPDLRDISMEEIQAVSEGNAQFTPLGLSRMKGNYSSEVAHALQCMITKGDFSPLDMLDQFQSDPNLPDEKFEDEEE